MWNKGGRRSSTPEKRSSARDVSQPVGREGSHQNAGGLPAVLFRIAREEVICHKPGSPHSTNIPHGSVAAERKVLRFVPGQPEAGEKSRLQCRGSRDRG